MRRKKARLINLSHPQHHQLMAQILLNNGVIGAIWAYHLYFLACNAFSKRAVARMNQLKNRPPNQVLVSPGAVEEAVELADLEKSVGLVNTARLMGISPIAYLEFLYRKFPLGVELYASNQAPATVTYETETGRTIWIAGHMSDQTYSQLLSAVRDLRKTGRRIVFAGTSLNLIGDNTLNVRQLDQVLSHFGDKIEAISVHPQAKSLKKVRFSTSCSAVSFIEEKPRLLRIGATPEATLLKYIPNLEVAERVPSTNKRHVT